MSEHYAMADTYPNADAPGGVWQVMCTCGWMKSGGYARTNEIAEYAALRIANAYGELHEKSPDAEVL